MAKILYIAPLFNGSTAKVRMTDLENLGHQVIPFDTYAFEERYFRIYRTIAYRYNAGPVVRDLNIQLQKIKSLFDFAWIDKGVWINEESVNYLKNKSKLKLIIHYTPDAQFLQHGSKKITKNLALYDFLVTTKWFEYDYYKALKKPFIVVKQGFDSRIIGIKNEFKFKRNQNIIFIGHCQQHYIKRLQAIAKDNIPYELYGPGWARIKPKGLEIQGDGLWGDAYYQKLKTSQMALGLLSKYIPETTTTRTYEIPASGSLLVAERSWEHLELFEEGKEALFFESDEEMIDKIRFALTHKSETEKIAMRGRARVIKDRYDSITQIEKVLKEVGI